MRITEVRVRKVDFEGRTRAFASVTFDDVFVVHDLRIIDGDHGPFVAMPNRRLPTGERKDIAHPLNNETRHAIQSAVLTVYEHEGESNQAFFDEDGSLRLIQPLQTSSEDEERSEE